MKRSRQPAAHHAVMRDAYGHIAPNHPCGKNKCQCRNDCRHNKELFSFLIQVKNTSCILNDPAKLESLFSFTACITMFQIFPSKPYRNALQALNFKKRKKRPGNLRFQNVFGGDKRDRTADLLNAIQALS